MAAVVHGGGGVVFVGGVCDRVVWSVFPSASVCVRVRVSVFFLYMSYISMYDISYPPVSCDESPPRPQLTTSVGISVSVFFLFDLTHPQSTSVTYYVCMCVRVSPVVGDVVEGREQVVHLGVRVVGRQAG